MEQKEQVSRIARAFGSALIEKGIQILQTSFKDIDAAIYTKGELADIVRNAGFTFPVSLSDEKYYTTRWTMWQTIRDIDLVHRLRYFDDKFDCDNYAFLFSSLATILFGLNTCGVAYGQVYGAVDKKFISGHAWNIIVETGGQLYCHEPMNNNSVLIEKSKPIIMGSWEYRPNWILFY